MSEIRPRLKGKIKKAYNNLIKVENRVLVIGDLHEPFCLPNYLSGVKIGVTTKIMVTHKSIGMVNKQWEKNKLFFEALYEKHFPLRVN